MKNLFNPFTRITGVNALLIGLVIMVLTSVIACYTNVALDGVLDVHIGTKLTWTKAFGYPFISHICFLLCAVAISFVFSRNFRVIDLVGTLTLARVPYLIVTLSAFFISVPSSQDILANPTAAFYDFGFVIFLFISFCVTVWSVLLIINAVRASCNFKSGKLAGVVIISIFVATVIGKMIIAKI